MKVDKTISYKKVQKREASNKQPNARKQMQPHATTQYKKEKASKQPTNKDEQKYWHLYSVPLFVVLPMCLILELDPTPNNPTPLSSAHNVLQPKA